MTKIQSVLGEIDTSKLGFTLSHEHVVVSSAGIPQIYPEFIRRDESIAEGVRQLSAAKKEGVDSIIDVSTLDLGRDIKLMEQVSRESGVNIICATGTWRDIPRAFWNASSDSVASLYVREIEEVYIGHSNDTTDFLYLEGLMDKGVWVGLDRYPGGRSPGTPDWETRTDTAMKLISDGYGKRIMLGHDWSVTLSIDSVVGQDIRKKSNPDGYLFITRNVLPRLKAVCSVPSILEIGIFKD